MQIYISMAQYTERELKQKLVSFIEEFIGFWIE